MTGAKIAWPLLLGLLVSGWGAAHGLAYRIVVPDATQRNHLLEETGHAYFDPAPLLALVVTLIALGLLCCIVRSRAAFRAPWIFGLLPPAAFVVQEHLERLLHDGQIPLTASLDPTFVVGLLLQLPFALAAIVVARCLIALSAALTRLIRRFSGYSVRRAIQVRRPLTRTAPFRICPLALGHGQRAPPRLLLR
jgi:hypothetical protein